MFNQDHFTVFSYCVHIFEKNYANYRTMLFSNPYSYSDIKRLFCLCYTCAHFAVIDKIQQLPLSFYSN